jgi:2-haloacid dehalogenase
LTWTGGALTRPRFPASPSSVSRSHRHEDPQFAEVAQGSPSRQSRDPSSRPHLRHQQDQSPLQSAPGLNPPGDAASITAVVFDIGGVLVDWDPRFLYERLIPEGEALDAFLRDVVTPDWHFQHDAGRPFAETSAELTARFPHHAALIAAWGPRFNESNRALIPGMAELVAELDAAGVPLFAITNFSGEFWPPFRAKYSALFDRFRAILVSGDERLVKPDPAIYRLALERFGIAAAGAAFIDDRAENVAGAEAVGMTGFLFSDAGALRTELAQAGLPLAASPPGAAPPA